MTELSHPDKAEVVRLLLETEGRVMLCLDATREGVDVPRRFATDPGLMLVLNSKMPQDIEIGMDGIASELRFGGIPHFCIIPYAALWSAFNPDTNHGMLWPESMPASIRRSHGIDQSGTGEEDHIAAGSPPPQLRVIEGGAPKNSLTPPTKGRKPNLRLVE